MVTTLSRPESPAIMSSGERLLGHLEALHRYYSARGLAGEDLSDIELRFAVALARYRFAAPSSRLLAERIGVMVFGGAGAGKSTVANILVGAGVTEVNPQAGYTRHPIAIHKTDSIAPSEMLPDRLGPLERDDACGLPNVDRDVFGYKALTQDGLEHDFLRRYVVWDCPDLTTKDASYYQSRVTEIAALAEVGVYVASDERYNDELPTNFLQAMLDAGKWIVVALTKAMPEDAETFVRLFREQVMSRLRHAERIVGIVPIPVPIGAKVTDLWTAAFPYGERLHEAIEQATGEVEEAKSQARAAAAKFLVEQQSRLLDPLRRDLGEWQTWVECVRRGANTAVQGYERDFLARVEYPQFATAQNETLALLELQLPERLLYVRHAIEFARMPYRLLRAFAGRFSRLAIAEGVDEDRTLEKTCRVLLDSLQITCASRATRHRLWAELHEAVEGQARAQIEPLFHQVRDRQRVEMQQRVLHSVRKVRERLENHTAMLTLLRGARVALDIVGLLAAVYGAYKLSGIPLLGGILGLILVILSLGAAEDVARWLVRFYVHRGRDEIKRQQKEQIRELVQLACIDPLLRMPPESGPRLYQMHGLAEQIAGELSQLSGAQSHGRLQ